MGRKKRKVVVEEPDGDQVEASTSTAMTAEVNPSASPSTVASSGPRQAVVKQEPKKEEEKKASSGYAMTTHSAEIIDEDVYISDGSESDEDLMAEPPEPREELEDDDEQEGEKHIGGESQAKGRSIEMILGGSKMGLMRRGIHHHSLLLQPNRQWSRQNKENVKAGVGGEETSEDAAAAEERRKREQEEELAKLDPAQRAARLLAEKQRKLEEAKITARRLESEENAGRDPCLFSKRTSFDIRFDQIDDKPWTRGGDISDFFNYGFQEEDWLEYSEQQLLIRQELIDANRQKRQPDPSIVPVVPKAPRKQNPKVAVSSSGGQSEGADDDHNEGDENAPVAGPELVKTEEVRGKGGEDVAPDDDAPQGPAKNEPKEFVDVNSGIGGAWGMGAIPGSKLAQLIEEQEKQMGQQQHFDRYYGDDMSHSRGNHDDMSVTLHPPYQPHQDQYPPRGGGGQWNDHGGGGGPGDRNQHGYGGGGGGHGGNWNGGGGHESFHGHGGPPPPPFQGRGGGGRGGFRGGRGGGGRFGGLGGRGRGGGRGDVRTRSRDDYEDRGHYR